MAYEAFGSSVEIDVRIYDKVNPSMQLRVYLEG